MIPRCVQSALAYQLAKIVEAAGKPVAEVEQCDTCKRYFLLSHMHNGLCSLCLAMDELDGNYPYGYECFPVGIADPNNLTFKDRLYLITHGYSGSKVKAL